MSRLSRSLSWLGDAIATGHATFKKARRQWRADHATARSQQRAEVARRNSRATFIGVTGSSAKSTSKMLLAHILKAVGDVGPTGGNQIRYLIENLQNAPPSCRFFIAECGIGNVGRMEPMAQLLRPNVAIVTMVGLEHKSKLRSRQIVAEEKAELVAAVQPGGLAMLNADDQFVVGMAERTSERVVTFGRSAGAKYRATRIHCAFPDRLRLDMLWPGGSLTLQTEFVGEHFWLPTLAAAATAIELGVAADVVAERVATFKPLFARFSVLPVSNGPTFIIDTVKAPWYSIQLAFDSLARATATRKRIVLGHMSDFAGSDSKYRDAYRLAAAVADQVIFVGNHAHRSKAGQADREKGRFLAFAAPEEAAAFLRQSSVPGELVLLKGSEDLHLERLALAFLHDVRCWKPACRKRVTCKGCGLYKHAYESHRGRRRKIRRRGRAPK